MFKKLKEKITEEVKSSPQRFQQLTQSVTDRLQNPSTSDENFFSIGDDDIGVSNTSSTNDSGFTSVSLVSPQDTRMRRFSNSSMASEASFLPRYDSVANMYHLQSDLDVSASEMEDNVSSASQLGNLNKQQIYSAFQKAQMQYHKYRGRYTDLARHYKELEKENGKIKGVLVETQDKAIRRVTELKEQCALEQKAKAHLEGMLRDEIDEKLLKIESLQTKCSLLQGGKITTENESDLKQEIEGLHEKIQEMKANVIIFQTKEQEYKSKIIGLEREITQLHEKEKENNLTLAQNKMDLHNELLNRENEISSLKADNETLKKKLDGVSGSNTKLENLQSQNSKLIEKLESLTKKCNNYESELLVTEQYKVEVQNLTQRNSSLESELEKVRDDAKKSLLSLEEKIRQQVMQEFLEKEEELKSDFSRQLDEITTNTATTKELQLDLINKNRELEEMKTSNAKILDELNTKRMKYDELERNHLELIEESQGLRHKVATLEKDDPVLEDKSLEILQLQMDLARFQDSDKKIEALEQQYKKLLDEKNMLEHEKDNLIRASATLEGQGLAHEEKILQLQTDLARFQDNDSKLGTLEQQCKTLLEEKNMLEQEKDNLMRASATLEEKILQLQSDLARFQDNDSKMEALEQQCKTLLDEKNMLEQEKDNLMRASATLEGKTLAREEKILQLQTDLARSLDNDKKLEALEEQYKKLLEEKEKLEKEKTDWMRCEEVFNKEIENMKELIDKNERQLDEVKKCGKEKDEELSKKEDEVHKLEETCSLLNQDLNQLRMDKQTLLDSITEKKEKSVNEIKVCEEEINKLKDQLENVEMKNNNLLEDVRNKTEEVKVLQESNLTLSSKIKSLENEQEMSELNNVIADLKEESEILKSNLTKTMEEMLVLREREQQYLAENEKSLDELDHLKKSLEQTNDDLKTKKNEIDNYQKNEVELLALATQLETEFKSKNGQFAQFSDIIQLDEISGEALDVRDKLSCIMKNIIVDRDNLGKILTLLDDYKREKCKLEDEKNTLLCKIQKLELEMSKIGAIDNLERELQSLKDENEKLMETQESISKHVVEFQTKSTLNESEKNRLTEENAHLLTEINECKNFIQELTKKTSEAESNLKDATLQISNLEQQVKEKPDTSEKLIHLQNQEEDYVKEIERLRSTITQYKSLDVTNQHSIEFYEDELQKMKKQNDKLTRRLDETIVTLQHCTELSNSTEIEYLKNVLYNYMLGKESLVLARVIAAVCKFDPQQTELILAKEQQKQTLLGHLGIL